MKRIKKLGLRTIACFLLFYNFAGQLFAEGYDSTYVLSIKQKFAIPEDVRTGDYVGIWKKTYTWRSGNSISFAIKTNYKSAFSINSTSGLITVVSPSSINGKVVQQDTVINLIIRTTDSRMGYEDDTCEIRVKENKYCKFFDYSYTGTKSGTRNQPYSDLSSTTIQGGYAYFIKRGNVPTKKENIISGFQATAKNPTILAAYGTGNNPAFDGSGLSSGAEAFDFKNAPSPSKYCYIYNIDVKNYPSMAFSVRSRNSNFGFYNCNFSKNVLADYKADLGDIYLFGSAADTLKNWGHELINLESKGTWAPILKTDASGVSAYNIKSETGNTLDALAFNFRFAVSYYSKLSHFYFVGGERSLQARYPYITITDGVIINSVDAGMFLQVGVTYDGKLHNLRIKNVLFRGNENGIYAYDKMIDKVTIENCRFESSKYDGIYFRNGGKDRVIQNCSFINNGSDGIELLNSGQASTNLGIYYNIFYGNKAKAINGVAKTCGNGVKVYNNTIVGVADLSGVSNGTVRNNFYQSLAGSATASNNLTIASINQSTYFKNPAGKDYRLLSTAVNAINKGYVVGLSYDCLKINIVGNPDIGAYEYKATSQSAVNNAPLISSQSFTVEKSDFQNIGTITASDNDADQTLLYSIIEGNENGYFSIDPQTGNITATSSEVVSLTSVNLTVQVTDNAAEPLSSTSLVTITFTGEVAANVNNAPTIDDQTINVNEEEFTNNIIGKVEATDIDNGQELTYSIVSGNTNNIFTIDPQTGELTSISGDIFNSSTLSYKLEIMVTDNGQDAKTATAEVSIELLAKSPTSSDEVEEATASIKVYPNPSRGDVNIEISKEDATLDQNNKPTVIEIIDLTGKIVKSKTIEDSGSVIDENFNLTDLPNGLYSVRMQLSDKITTKKLILSK